MEVVLLLSSSAVQEAHLVQRRFSLSVRITGGCDGAGRAGALKGLPRGLWGGAVALSLCQSCSNQRGPPARPQASRRPA